MTPAPPATGRTSPEFIGMTDSLLITAQLADLRGDRAFAAELRASGAHDPPATRTAWTGRWYCGYDLVRDRRKHDPIAHSAQSARSSGTGATSASAGPNAPEAGELRWPLSGWRRPSRSRYCSSRRSSWYESSRPSDT
jgi:hypothetical protein